MPLNEIFSTIMTDIQLYTKLSDLPLELKSDINNE